MSYIDLQDTLGDWPYDPEQISVRKILGADGKVRIQMRVELGLLQMEAEGRPDGARPLGCKTLVEYHERRIEEYERRHDSTTGFVLTKDECQALREEASLYYRRYVASFVLEDYKDVIRDTSHNLAIFDLCRDYADDPVDREGLESFRSYVIMMETRAHAFQALSEDEPSSALAHVNRGLLNIKAHYERRGELERVEEAEEVKMLRGLAGELAGLIPQDSLLVTRKALRAAIEREQFERAAVLRDTLKALYDGRH